jgi:hypothetical protein
VARAARTTCGIAALTRLEGHFRSPHCWNEKARDAGHRGPTKNPAGLSPGPLAPRETERIIAPRCTVSSHFRDLGKSGRSPDQCSFFVLTCFATPCKWKSVANAEVRGLPPPHVPARASRGRPQNRLWSLTRAPRPRRGARPVSRLWSDPHPRRPRRRRSAACA